MRGKKTALFPGIMLIVTALLLIVLGIVTYKMQNYPPLSGSHQNSLAATPPMGWNGWNHFRCSPELNEQSFKEMVDVLVASGMKEAGYRYVNLDDCWQLGRRADGTIEVDTQRFPNGIKSLAEYVHSKGLLFGMYTSAGRITCEGRAGSYHYEFQDAKQYADWGVDYLKVDWCGIEYLDTYTQYSLWQEAIQASGRPMVLSIAIAAIDSIKNNEVWLWGHGVGDSWRTARDIQDFWSDMLRVLDKNSEYAEYSGVGGWNDADMLEVGNGGMTLEEYKTHFSLWALMASPLLAGNDLRTMSPEIRDILTRKEIIAINQDPLGYQGRKIAEKNGIEIWEKVLQKKGDRAYALLNRGEEERAIELVWKDMQLFPLVLYTDLWQDEGFHFSFHSLTQTVPPHGVKVLKVSGIDSL